MYGSSRGHEGSNRFEGFATSVENNRLGEICREKEGLLIKIAIMFIVVVLLSFCRWRRAYGLILFCRFQMVVGRIK